MLSTAVFFPNQLQIQNFPDKLRQLQKWGHQPIIWPNFSWKLYENERNRTRGGGGEGACVPGALLRFANENAVLIWWKILKITVVEPFLGTYINFFFPTLYTFINKGDAFDLRLLSLSSRYNHRTSCTEQRTHN